MISLLVSSAVVVIYLIKVHEKITLIHNFLLPVFPTLFELDKGNPLLDIPLSVSSKCVPLSQTDTQMFSYFQ